MKLFTLIVAVVFFGSIMFYLGWMMGAGVTARQIADAVLTGQLSLHQRLEHIAEQILSGNYIDINGRLR